MRHHFNPATLCGSSRNINDCNGHQDAIAKLCKQKSNTRTKSLDEAVKTFQRPCCAVLMPDEQEYVRIPISLMRQYREQKFAIVELW